MTVPQPRLQLGELAVELSEENLGFEFRAYLPCDDPYKHYVIRFDTTALIDSPEMDAPVALGRAEGLRIDLPTAVEAGLNLHELFDAQSAELSDFYPLLYRPNNSGQLARKVGRFKPGSVCTLLYLSRLEIRPQARGLGLGSRAIRHIERVMGISNGVVGLKAFPLDDGAEADRYARIPQLRRFYQALDFEPLAGDFMVADAGL